MSSRVFSDEKIQEIVERLGAELHGELSVLETPPPVEMRIEVEVPRVPDALAEATAAIRAADTQVGALRALLDGAHGLGARAALFVLRDDDAELWEGVGFDDDPLAEGGLKGKRLPTGDGSPLAPAIHGDALDCHGDRIPDFGQRLPAAAHLAPIAVQERVVGLLYADTTDPDSPLDTVGLTVLVTTTGLGVERLALARALGQRAAAEGPTGPVRAPAAPPSQATETGPIPQPKPVSIPIATQPEAPVSPLAPEDDSASPEVEDARRFARLLMEEICLYNGDKVEEGRNEQDLRSRLADEVEQARIMYNQRVAPEVAAQGDFFEEALVRVLAAGNAGALGEPEGVS